jgi:propionyl-CoA carboxylase beta chain
MPKESFDKLAEMREKALEAGGEDRKKKQHDAGKYTARERVEKLLDPGSFVEIEEFVVHRETAFGIQDKKVLGDGVITGYGTIDGRSILLAQSNLVLQNSDRI